MIAVILFKIITMVRYYNADIPIVKHYPNFPNLLMITVRCLHVFLLAKTDDGSSSGGKYVQPYATGLALLAML